MEFDTYYKEFIKFKLTSQVSYLNLFKKIRNFEDLKYACGLIQFALTKIVFKHLINNETIRGR